MGQGKWSRAENDAWNMLMSMFSGKGGGKFQRQYKRKEPMDESGGVFGEFKGTIKSFRNGYGFIECEDLKAVGCDGDAFLHGEQLLNYKVGQVVKFTLFKTAEGKFQ